MLTIFSTPKPFAGHIGIIQRNAIQSWLRLDPAVEVILFGDDTGAAETARQLNIRHEPEVNRSPHGTKYLASIFDRAQEIARYELLCYVNCDIIFLPDFRAALQRVLRRFTGFLMVGQRWDTDILEPIDFSQLNWDAAIRTRALRANHRRPPQWIDFFVFSRGLYHTQIPRFVIGRPGWDNWLVWFARFAGVPVLDVSQVVLAVHQNHDYSYHPDGEKGVWEGEEARQNYALLQHGRCFRTIENATHRLSPGGFQKNYHHYITLMKRQGDAVIRFVWFALLNVTRPIRHRLGLRSGARASASMQK
jgi:hypothetical protein